MEVIVSKKFYKTIVSFEVLSDEPLPRNLKHILYECEFGTMSRSDIDLEQTELTPKAFVNRCYAQGTDPTFFGLTGEGEELDEE